MAVVIQGSVCLKPHIDQRAGVCVCLLVSLGLRRCACTVKLVQAVLQSLLQRRLKPKRLTQRRCLRLVKTKPLVGGPATCMPGLPLQKVRLVFVLIPTKLVSCQSFVENIQSFTQAHLDDTHRIESSCPEHQGTSVCVHDRCIFRFSQVLLQIADDVQK